MNDLEKWTLDEVKELLNFSSTLEYFFIQERPNFDVVNHCLTEGDFGFITEANIVENPERETFQLSMTIEFYCLVEIESDNENEDQTPEEKAFKIYLHVRDRIGDIRSKLGSLPYALQEWDFGDEEEFPLVSSDIKILDASEGLVKVTQKYILNDYSPILALPPENC